MELIKVTRNEDGTIAVSCRELHEFLEVTERYSTWFERMKKYGFEENVDFVGCKVFNALAKQELQDHALTIDTAKEIAMIQRNEKGKQARKYFIDFEKKYKEQPKQLSQWEIMRALFNEVDEQKKEVKELKTEVTSLSESMRISGAQELEINTLGKQRAVKCLGGKESYIYQKYSRKMFPKFWSQFNKYFMIPRYSELPKSKFEQGKRFISMWEPPTEIKMQLKEIEQMSLFEGERDD